MSNLLLSASHYVGLAIDIAIVMILLCFSIVGFKKGFLKSIIALFSTVVVLILAVYFANHFAKLINSVYDFTALIAKKITPSIEKIDGIYASTFPEGMSGSEFYHAYIASSGTNSILKKFFQYSLKGFGAEGLAGLKVSEVLAGSIASLIMTIIAGVLLFIIIKIAVNLLSRLFDNIASTKIFGGINKLFGFLFGAIKGAVVVLFFVLLTIGVSFVPKANKKIYPLVQNETYITKAVYNTTDKYVEKYLIKSDVISKWINNLWDNRNLDPVKEKTVAETAEMLDNTFTNNAGNYEKSYTEIKATSSSKYYRINKTSEITNQNVNITITLEYTGSDIITFDLYAVSDLNTSIVKSGSSTAISFVYDNINYSDFVLKLTSNGTDITTTMNILITENL